MRRNWPLAFKSQKIGLLGGSFDPAHSGHLHVAQTSAAILGLSKVWWLVSPQNPLKASSSPLLKRIQSAKKIARGPKMVVTSIESDLQSKYTIDTLKKLKALYSGVKFVWLMGGDNLAGFEHWKGWKRIVGEVPICVVSRPQAGAKAIMGRMARQFAKNRQNSTTAKAILKNKSPSWVYLQARFNHLSSTSLRAKNQGL